MHGQGVLKASDGSHFKAEWHHGQPQEGHWCSADGKTEYEGQVKGMAWHGFGTLHQTAIRKYMGKESAAYAAHISEDSHADRQQQTQSWGTSHITTCSYTSKARI